MNETNINKELENAFDYMAKNYDVRYLENVSMRLMRKRVRSELVRCFKREEEVLELGCGTGEDAVFLAERGCKVTAVDCSANMLKTAEEKIDENLKDAVRFAQVEISELELKFSEKERFDGIFSNFGALNTLSDPSIISGPVYDLLKTGGRFVVCIMPRHCIWDWIIDLFSLRINALFHRRSKKGTTLKVGSYEVKCYFPTPAEYRRAFKGLIPERCEVLGLLYPPPRFTDRHPGLEKLWELTNRAESLIGNWNPLCGLGDHFLLTMRKP